MCTYKWKRGRERGKKQKKMYNFELKNSATCIVDQRRAQYRKQIRLWGLDRYEYSVCYDEKYLWSFALNLSKKIAFCETIAYQPKVQSLKNCDLAIQLLISKILFFRIRTLYINANPIQTLAENNFRTPCNCILHSQICSSCAAWSSFLPFVIDFKTVSLHACSWRSHSRLAHSWISRVSPLYFPHTCKSQIQ